MLRALLIWTFLALIEVVHAASDVYQIAWPGEITPYEDGSASRWITELGLPLTLGAPEMCGTFLDVPFTCSSYIPSFDHENTEWERVYEHMRKFGTIPVVTHAPWPAPLPGVAEYRGDLYEAGHQAHSEGLSTLKITRTNELPSAVYGWADVDSVIRGRRVVEGWQTLAEDQTPFSCLGHTCSILVRAEAREGEQSVEGIAACSIRLLGDSRSAPSYCQFIWVNKEGREYMKAAVSFTNQIYASAGRTDFEIFLSGYDTPGRISDLDDRLIAIFSEALESAPFHLDIYIQGNNVVGSADYARLEFLNRWTLQTVRIFQTQSGTDGLGFGVATTLYVSPQNSARSSDWKMPSPPQAARYRDALLENIKDAISKKCLDAEWVTTSQYEVKCTRWL